MRDYISTNVVIDGRHIPYPIQNAAEYFLEHEHLTSEEIELIIYNQYDLFQKVSQIIALKQSCFLLWHTTHSCQSLHDSLIDLKNNLIKELSEVYQFVFDEEWLESLAERNS